MTPFYDHQGITIYHADCRDVLPMLPDGSIDLVVADPPYGVTSLAWDAPVSDWPGLLLPLLAPYASLWCFGSLRSFLALSQTGAFAGWKLAQDLVWEKHNGSGFQADRFRRVHEQIVQFYPASSRWSQVYKTPVMTDDARKRTVRRKRRPPHYLGGIGEHVYRSVDGGPRLMRSVLPVRSCHGYAVHPTQKPEGIVEPLLRASLRPGGVVLDPFLGSGTTLVVAKRLGARAIGIESDERFCAIAARRIDAG